MYRQPEDEWEIERLNEERSKLVEENKKLKEKLERKKYKIQNLKGNLATALAQAGLSIDDIERIQYEKEQQELRNAALHKVQLAPFCDVREEEEPTIPFDDVGERIIVRDGKPIKQVKHIRGFDDNGEEICFYQEWELTKRELEEMEEENQKMMLIEAAKHDAERQIRISEEEPSIPYDENNERIIFRNGKTYKQWFQYGFGCHIWYAEKEIASECE
jgi:hypothetical protein